VQGKAEITREQTIFFIFIGVIGNIVYSHTWIDNDADRSSWVAAFLGIMLLIPFVIWLLNLAKHYPGLTIADIIEKCMGKLPCWIFCILYILLNASVAWAQLTMFTQMLNVFFLRNTPYLVIILVLSIICILISNSEVRVIGRLVEILAVLGLIIYLTGFVFAFPSFIHIKYIIPIFDTTLPLLIKSTIYITGVSTECLLLLMTIVSYIPDPSKHYMWIVKGIILSAVIFSMAILIINAIMGPEMAKRIAFGGVNAAILIHLGEFVHGLEVLVFGTYQFIAIGKTALCMYCILTSIKKMFNSQKSKLPLTATAIIVSVPPILISAYDKAYFLAVTLGSYILLPFSIFILSIVSLGVFMKLRKTGSAGQ
jgi:spore germination protein (amino acid permease)